jgi:hypothetical protein
VTRRNDAGDRPNRERTTPSGYGWRTGATQPSQVATVTVVLTSYDDFPLHQSSAPMAYSATADANHYDRYFFNGYSPSFGDDRLFFALAMGLYPNRHVSDAAFSVVTAEGQRSVFASQRAPLDRRDATTVGPLRVEVIEPLHRLRIVIDAPEHLLRAELEFTSRSPALEEPHFFLRAGTRPMFDYTRLTQFGRWQGWVEVAGHHHDVTPDVVVGCRDRSWGVRPVGEPAASGAPVAAPQFFWLWAPTSFSTRSTHFDVNEHGDGTRWHHVGAVLADGDQPATLASAVDWRVSWRPGTRWADSFEYEVIDDAGRHSIALRPQYEFQMSGLGYGHPRYNHGSWHGESMVDGQLLTLPIDTPCAREHLHVQALCEATYTGADGTVEHGVGILEQLAIGPHPSGLTGIFDPYDPA